MNYLVCYSTAGTNVSGFAERGEAEGSRQGKYSYVVGSLEELISTCVPIAVLRSVVESKGQKSARSRKRLEKEAWKIMEEMTEEQKKAASEQEKADKKAAAEAKKQEAAAKKEAAAKAKADKQAAAEAKKQEAAAKKEAAEKAKADKKAAAEAKKQEAAAKKEQNELAKSRIGAEETVKVLVSNPKREGSDSFKRFALYQDGMTVKQFLDAGGTMADIHWDLGHRFISLTPVAGDQARAQG